MKAGNMKDQAVIDKYYIYLFIGDKCEINECAKYDVSFLNLDNTSYPLKICCFEGNQSVTSELLTFHR